MRWNVTTPPEALPVTWDELKLHLNMDNPDHRDAVLMEAATATAYAEFKMQCSLMQRTITAVFEAGDDLRLPRGPVIVVTSVVDADSNDIDWTEKHVGYSTYIVPAGGTYPLTVVYEAGYPSAELIDADIRGAIRIDTATRFLFKENVSMASVNDVHRLDDFYRSRCRVAQVL